jgi:hypothetical protein
VSLAEIKQRLAATKRKVDRHFRKGLHNHIFKGKWLPSILADEIDRTMAGRPYDNNRLATRLPCTIPRTLHFMEPWADYFRNAIRVFVDSSEVSG